MSDAKRAYSNARRQIQALDARLTLIHSVRGGETFREIEAMAHGILNDHGGYNLHGEVDLRLGARLDGHLKERAARRIRTAGIVLRHVSLIFREINARGHSRQALNTKRRARRGTRRDRRDRRSSVQPAARAHA